jgi:hypothetical protein
MDASESPIEEESVNASTTESDKDEFFPGMTKEDIGAKKCTCFIRSHLFLLSLIRYFDYLSPHSSSLPQEERLQKQWKDL